MPKSRFYIILYFLITFINYTSGQDSPQFFIGNSLPEFDSLIHIEGSEYKVVGKKNYLSINGTWVEKTNSVMVLKNYDDLRQIVDKAVSLVYVEDFNSVTGGLFFRSTVSYNDDNGTIINSIDSTTWKRVFNNALGVNVDWFNIIDNTSRFNYAIKRAESYNTYLTIPGKKYLFETSFVDSLGYYLIATNRTSIFGNDSTEIVYKGTDPVAVLRALNADKIKIENFNVQFENAIFSSLSIHGVNFKNSIITNCRFTGGHWGILLTNESNNNEINSITSVSDNGGHNIEINGSSYNHVYNCNLTNTYGIINVPGNNIEIYSKPNLYQKAQFNLIENNECKSGSVGVVIIGSCYNTIRNNYIRDQRIAGVASFAHDVYGVPCEGNLFLNNDINNCANLDVVSAGIVITGRKNIVSKNRVYNNGSSGLDSDGIAIYGNQTTVSENEIFENFGHGIKVAQNEGSDIEKNIIYNNSNISNNSGDGIRIFDSSNLIVKENRIYDNRAIKKQNYGIYLDPNTTNTDVYNNEIYDNSSHNIYNNNHSNNIFSNSSNILGQIGGIQESTIKYIAQNLQTTFDISLGKGINFLPLTNSDKIDVSFFVNGVLWNVVSINENLGLNEYTYTGTNAITLPMSGGEKITIKVKH